jgi:hypothetical protein
MKNKKASFFSIIGIAAGLFAFTTLQGGSIKGKVIPADGASQVWAISNADTLKAAISQGNFEITRAKAGTYKVYIDAIDPYKDIVKDGVQVNDGSTVDLGEIQLTK